MPAQEKLFLYAQICKQLLPYLFFINGSIPLLINVEIISSFSARHATISNVSIVLLTIL